MAHSNGSENTKMDNGTVEEESTTTPIINKSGVEAQVQQEPRELHQDDKRPGKQSFHYTNPLYSKPNINHNKEGSLTPENTSKNEEYSCQLRPTHSNNRKFPSKTGSSLEIKPGHYCDPTTVLKPNNKVTRSVRCFVVCSEYFEDAMRVAQAFSLELAYSNIFIDSGMPILLPVYKGGYINRKDRKDME